MNKTKIAMNIVNIIKTIIFSKPIFYLLLFVFFLLIASMFNGNKAKKVNLEKIDMQVKQQSKQERQDFEQTYKTSYNEYENKTNVINQFFELLNSKQFDYAYEMLDKDYKQKSGLTLELFTQKYNFKNKETIYLKGITKNKTIEVEACSWKWSTEKKSNIKVVDNLYEISLKASGESYIIDNIVVKNAPITQENNKTIEKAQPTEEGLGFENASESNEVFDIVAFEKIINDKDYEKMMTLIDEKAIDFKQFKVDFYFPNREKIFKDNTIKDSTNTTIDLRFLVEDEFNKMNIQTVKLIQIKVNNTSRKIIQYKIIQ